jgi:hypothetical protein
MMRIALCFVVTAALAGTDTMSRKDPYRDVPRIEDYQIVGVSQHSELEQFALFFNQDWKLMFPDFYRGTKLYLESLPAARRKVLAQEFKAFLETNASASPKKLLKLWLALGAAGWQSDLDIRAGLKDLCWLIETDPTKAPDAP